MSTTVNLIVGASTDDARNIFSNSTYTATSATQHLGNFSGTRYYNGWRFTSVAIPQGAIISSAKLTMYVSNVNGGTTALVSFWGEAADNPGAFANTTAGKPQGRVHTTAQVNQSFTTANWATVGYQANASEIPELATIIQEIVNRPGWASGNSLVITAFDNTSTNPGYVGFATWDNSPAKATKLDITYTVQTPPTTALNTPLDTATVTTLTPTLNFTGTDADGDAVEYEAQVDTVSTFNSSAGIPARVQGTTGTTGATFPTSLTTSAFSAAVTSGNAIIVSLVADGLTSDTTFTVTDSASNTYSRLSHRYLLNTDQVDVWIATNVTGGSGITITAGNLGNTTAAIIAEEWSGVISASALDQAAVADTAGTPSSSMSVGPTSTTTTANDVILLAFCASAGATTSSTATGFSNATRVQSNPSVLFVQSKVVSATGTQSAATTLSSSQSWVANIVAIKGGTGPLIDAKSATDAGFTAGHPFTSGVAKDYTVQSSLTNSTTYYWRVRAIDPSGTNSYGAWATTRSFTVTLSGGTTTISITKSARYAVRTTPSAITKTGIYRIKKPLSLTKSAIYEIKKAVSVTKSARYAVKTTPAAKTKSAIYRIKNAALSLTKSGQYEIKKAISVTKSARYAVKATPAAKTKAAKYTVIKAVSITKSAQYIIANRISITKSAKYTVLKAVSITKSAKYTVFTHPSAITKSARYGIKRVFSLTKAAQYEVKKSLSITKSARYAVILHPSAITKSARYAVKKTLSSTKSAQYAIKKTYSITKSAQYTLTVVTTVRSITKSSIYRIKTRPSLTLSARYVTRKVTAITKSARYVIYSKSAITKSAQYATRRYQASDIPSMQALTDQAGIDNLQESYYIQGVDIYPDSMVVTAGSLTDYPTAQLVGQLVKSLQAYTDGSNIDTANNSSPTIEALVADKGNTLIG